MPFRAVANARLFAAACLLAVAVVCGCGALYGLAGYPPEVTRSTPPPGIKQRSKAKSQTAPAIRGVATLPNQGELWVKRDGRMTVVVFYRGHW